MIMYEKAFIMNSFYAVVLARAEQIWEESTSWTILV